MQQALQKEMSSLEENMKTLDEEYKKLDEEWGAQVNGPERCLFSRST
jgi:predicted nuclease with TOPRIM domain